MSAEIDIFSEINNAVLDLQNSQYQNYSHPLKKLAKLLHHNLLETHVKSLTVGQDLDAFLNSQPEHRGLGEHELNWPESPETEMGMKLLLIDRFANDPNYMAQFGYQYYQSGQKIIGDIRAVTSQIIIPLVRDFKGYVLAKGKPKLSVVTQLSNKVFIVHGHDDGAKQNVARLLEKLKLEPIILHEQPNRSQTVIEKFEANSDVGFAVVLLTPDDVGRAAGDSTLKSRARQNVFLELGYFIGLLGRDRVCALKKGDIEIPSDYVGVLWEPMDDGGAWKTNLAKELKAAGYSIDLNYLA